MRRSFSRSERYCGSRRGLGSLLCSIIARILLPAVLQPGLVLFNQGQPVLESPYLIFKSGFDARSMPEVPAPDDRRGSRRGLERINGLPYLDQPRVEAGAGAFAARKACLGLLGARGDARI